MDLERAIVRCRDNRDAGSHLQQDSKRVGTAHVCMNDVDSLVASPVGDAANVRRFAVHLAVNKPDALDSCFFQPAIFAAQDGHFVSP